MGFGPGDGPAREWRGSFDPRAFHGRDRQYVVPEDDGEEGEEEGESDDSDA